MVSFCTSAPDVEATSLLSARGGRMSLPKPSNNHTTSIAGTDADYAGMSMAERERAYNELHCVAEAPAEDPEAIQRGLYELDCHIELLKNKASGSAYRLAEAQDAEYVRNRKFRLMFLRADQYEPRRAAERTVRFFVEKLRLFGKDKLTQDIQYQDLSEDDLESLYCGSMQFLPEKDRAGRLIFFGVASRKKYKTVDNYSRAQFYMLMSCIIEDESVQLKGVNCILYHVDMPTNDMAIVRSTTSLRHAIPMRIPAAHACLRDGRLQSLLQLCARFIDMPTKFGYRFHLGTHTECMYALMGFGIPVSAMPCGVEGGEFFGVEYHLKWIEEHKSMDRQRREKRLSETSTASMNAESQEDHWAPFAKLDLSGEDVDPTLLSDSIMEDYGECGDDDLLTVADAAADLLCESMLTDIEPMAVDDDEGATNNLDLNLIGPDHLSFFPSMVTDMIADGLESMKSSGVGGFVENDLVARSDNNTPAPRHASLCLSHEDDQSRGTTIFVTRPTDVLMGRGLPLQKHPGNVMFRNLVSSRIDAYEAASKGGKTQITIEVIELVKEASGRFLKPARDLKASTADGGEWEEVDDHTARLKVAFTFRSVRKVLRKR